MAVDINAELYTIKNSIYGSEMRQAIYDALKKCADQPGGGSSMPIGRAIPERSGYFGFVGEEVRDDV